MLHFFGNFSRDLCLDLIYFLSIIFSGFVLLFKYAWNPFEVDFIKFGINFFFEKMEKVYVTVGEANIPKSFLV